MTLRSLFARAGRLVGIGRAVVAIRKASTGEERLRARKFAVELLGGARGLAAKVGQMMAQDEASLQETLEAASQPMPASEVRGLIEAAYGEPVSRRFSHIDETGIPASLGQVNFATLRDGRAVAVKVQYPDIRQAVAAELRLLGWLPRAGPVARFGISLDGYQRAFADNCERELDYLEEAGRQARYRELAGSLSGLVVPEVLLEHCRPGVLVQHREEGFSLDKAAGLPAASRQLIAAGLLDHFLVMLFRHGFLHADPHPGNWAFRQCGRRAYSAILYDYGCVLEVGEARRLALLRAILAVRDRECVPPVACLSALGFDAEKLGDLASVLPALLGVLFEPFSLDQPFDVRRWQLSRRIDLIAGDLKWWFRSAAPPDLIFLMRALHGLVSALDRLDAPLYWGRALAERAADLFGAARALKLDEAKGEGGVPFSGVARYLKVRVEKSRGTKIDLTMPARLAEDLEQAMDETVLELVSRQAVDLEAIQVRARRSGFVPGTLFELADSERSVRVWLE